jgi:uncharacterized protein with PQ loop repeat
MISSLNVLSASAIFVFVISAIPQIRKIRIRKSSGDVSLSMALLIAGGNLMMLVRALGICDVWFSVNYAFQLALWLTVVLLICRYRS